MQPFAEVRCVAVHGVALDRPVDLDRDDPLLARPGPPLGRIAERPRLPPVPGSHEHARALIERVPPDRLDHRPRFLELDVADRPSGLGVPGKAGIASRQLDLADERGEPVAVAPVDALVGGPEHRDLVAAFVRVVELGAHHRRKDPAANVRRIDADDGDARALDRAARNGDLVVEGTGAAHRLLPFESGVHATERQVAPEALELLVRRIPRPVLADGAERLAVLGGAPADPNLDRH